MTASALASRPRRVLALLALGAVAAGPPGQGALVIVDATGGPGAQFVDIPAAILAARPGDRIVVRPGAYSAFVLQKPIAVLGQPGARIDAPATPLEPVVTIRDVPAGTACTVAGLQLTGAYFGVVVDDCPGRVSLEDVAIDGPSLEVFDSAAVNLRRCSVDGIARLERSTVQVHDTSAARLAIADADVVLSRCCVDVRAPVFGGQPGDAVFVHRSRLTVTGDGSGGYAASPTRGFAFAGTATTLVLDPDVRLSSGERTPVSPFIAMTVAEVPSLSVIAGPIGSTLLLDLFGEPGDPFVLLLGLPGGPLAVPGLRQRLWLDPRILAVVRTGVLGGSARFRLQANVPNRLGLVGVQLVGQALAGQGAALGFSNAPLHVHGL